MFSFQNLLIGREVIKFLSTGQKSATHFSSILFILFVLFFSSNLFAQVCQIRKSYSSVDRTTGRKYYWFKGEQFPALINASQNGALACKVGTKTYYLSEKYVSFSGGPGVKEMMCFSPQGTNEIRSNPKRFFRNQNRNESYPILSRTEQNGLPVTRLEIDNQFIFVQQNYSGENEVSCASTRLLDGKSKWALEIQYQFMGNDHLFDEAIVVPANPNNIKSDPDPFVTGFKESMGLRLFVGMRWDLLRNFILGAYGGYVYRQFTMNYLNNPDTALSVVRPSDLTSGSQNFAFHGPNANGLLLYNLKFGDFGLRLGARAGVTYFIEKSYLLKTRAGPQKLSELSYSLEIDQIQFDVFPHLEFSYKSIYLYGEIGDKSASVGLGTLF